MKIRPSFLLLCAAIIVLTVLVVWFAKRPAKTSVPLASQLQPEETVAATPQLLATNVPPPITSPAVVPTPSNTVSVPRKSKEQETLEILSTKNDIPIVFFGKLEDQFGNPVANAEIAAGVRIYNGVQSTVERFSVNSDANGLFQINHGKGESLGIMPKKAGYTLATTDTEFRYSQLDQHPYVPDAGNPTVIKMWKLQGAELLVGIDQHHKLHYTDAPINFDLLTGQIVPTGGDIRLMVSRSPGIMSGRNRLDWRVQIEVVDGGLMESGGQDAITFTAPENGYLPSDTLVFSTNAPNKWSGLFNQGFFVMSRNGQVYSKLGISFRINENPDDFMYITFSGVANTNGSRNWEGDPNTIKPQ
jgi:hypothetical protein